MNQIKSIFFAAATAAFAFAAPMAQATPTTTLDYTSGTSNIFNTNGSTGATVNGTSVNVGAFDLTQRAPGIAELPSRFMAWCLELVNVLPGQVYTVTEDPFVATSGALSSDQKDDIQRLFNVAFDVNSGGIPAPWAAETIANPQSAGIQLALWDIMGFTITGAIDSTVQSVRTSLLSAVNDDTLTFASNYRVVYLESTTSQNLVTVAPIPLPAGILTLMLGLGGLVALRRRRSAAA